MSVSNLIKDVANLEEALKCNVCKNLLNDPLLMAKCGHSTCRECFQTDFNTKCPICKVPVNSKDSLEDKLLNELLQQLQKLKQNLNTGSHEESEKELPEQSENDACAIAESLDANVEDTAKEIDVPIAKEAVQNKTKNVENISDALPNFATSTPNVKRKKKISRSKHSNKVSSGEENMVKGTPCSSGKSRLASRMRRTSTPAHRAREYSRSSKSNSSLNSSLNTSTLNKKNHKGETLLHQAVIKGDTAKVKELLKEGAAVNTVDNNGWTPLHEASNHGFVEIAKLLLDYGALVNIPSMKDNITPLHDALMNDQMQIAILLVSRGADLQAKTAMGHSAIDLCKNDEDKAALVESCSPYTCSNVTNAKNNKKAAHGDNDKIVLLYTTLNDKQKEHLQKCAVVLKAEVVDNFTPEVTHVITACDSKGNCTRTMKVLQGILTGKWILNYRWIEVCLEYKLKVDEEAFEVQGTKNQPNTHGPKNARKNMEQKLPSLFDGFYFCLHGPFHKPTPEKEDLCNLITIGGGKILAREPREDTVASENYRLPYHAPATPVEGVSHVVLYQDKPPRDHHYRTGHISTTHVMWLIECISEFKLKDFKDDKISK